MKLSKLRRIITYAIPVLFSTILYAQDTLNVTANGFSSYSINGETNPTLTVIRGNTYVFNVSAPGHPFWINLTASTGTSNAYNDGVTGNGTSSGMISFTVPESAPDELFYNCQFHSSMTGKIAVTSTVNLSAERQLPEKFKLKQNFPNPFNPSTQITYEIQNSEFVDLSIISISGEKVRQLFNGYQNAGVHYLIWDGKNEAGNPAGSGTYIYQLKTKSGIQTKKMSLVR